jgi:alpha-beta hydrolase superfamily lysophospholipase
VTDYKEFPDRGHSLALDSGRHEVADAVLAWLKQRSL